MKASIIIPCFNAEKTIVQCIESLLNQKAGLSFEIIAIDDGSNDRTAEMLNSLQTQGKITAIFRKNGGPAKARNIWAEAAKGELIAFIDSDCIAEKNWLEEMVMPFNDEKVAGVQGAYRTKQRSLIARFVQIEIEDRYRKMLSSKAIDWI